MKGMELFSVVAAAVNIAALFVWLFTGSILAGDVWLVSWPLAFVAWMCANIKPKGATK